MADDLVHFNGIYHFRPYFYQARNAPELLFGCWLTRLCLNRSLLRYTTLNYLYNSLSHTSLWFILSGVGKEGGPYMRAV